MTSARLLLLRVCCCAVQNFSKFNAKHTNRHTYIGAAEEQNIISEDQGDDERTNDNSVAS